MRKSATALIPPPKLQPNLTMTLSSALHQLKCLAAPFMRQGRHTSIAVLLCITTGYAVAQPAPSIVEVKAGDTFSSIATRFTHNRLTWRQLYRPNLTGLPNPNLILVGMRFEAVIDSDGKQYLRLLGSEHSMARTADAPSSPPTSTARSMTVPAPFPVTATPTLPPAISTTGNTLVIGVLPNISQTILSANYQRMVRYLERGNGQKVSLVVPRTFKEFFDSMIKGEYDLAIAAPNFARVAQIDRGMTPLLMYQPQINALFVAPVESTVQGPLDVRDHVVAFANPTSLVALYGQQWLKQAGVEANNYEVRAARTDLGVGRMMLSGEAIAAIMSNGEFRSIPPDEFSRLRIVQIFAKIPNFIFMANPRIGVARTAQLKQQLLGFFADAEEGSPFAQATGFTGLTEVDNNTLLELDSFTAATRRAMDYSK